MSTGQNRDKPKPPWAKLPMEFIGGPCDGDTGQIDVRQIKEGSRYVVSILTSKGVLSHCYIMRGKRLIWEPLDKGEVK